MHKLLNNNFLGIIVYFTSEHERKQIVISMSNNSLLFSHLMQNNTSREREVSVKVIRRRSCLMISQTQQQQCNVKKIKHSNVLSPRYPFYMNECQLFYPVYKAHHNLAFVPFLASLSCHPPLHPPCYLQCVPGTPSTWFSLQVFAPAFPCSFPHPTRCFCLLAFSVKVFSLEWTLCDHLL